MNILDYETVALNEENKSLVIIDQTLLPNETRIIELTEAEEIFDAIYHLKVRGAPAIGVAAGIAMYILADKLDDNLQFEEFYGQFEGLK